MSDFQTQYAQWDKFLSDWPRTRLDTMTLDKYTKAGEKKPSPTGSNRSSM